MVKETAFTFKGACHHTLKKELEVRGMTNKGVTVLIVLVCFLICYPQNARAYLDPGTGSLAFQALIGVLMAAVLTIKVWWGKLKSVVTGLSKKKDDK